MGLNAYLNEMVGKTISGVVVKEGPRQMIFVVFSDDTHMEFYGSDIHNIKGIRPGGMEEVLSYCPDIKLVQVHSEE